jgi:hypothetical protein
MGRRGLAFSLRRRAASLLPIVQWDRDDALHVAPSVLLDVDDLKSRPDLVVARLAGQKKQHEITHDNRQDLDAAASGQDGHGNQDEENLSNALLHPPDLPP